MEMTKKIKILHLEDEETDADLVSRILKKTMVPPDIMVVDNKEDFVEGIIKFSPDVILSDHTLPSFNSAQALNIFQQSGLRIPFILVTATISEEYAVSVIKAGADDYILKDRLEKLPEAITSSLQKIEAQVKVESDQAHSIKEIANAVLTAHEQERSLMGTELLENINQILAASNLYIDCAISEEDKRMIFMQNSKKFILMAIDEIKKISQIIMPPILGDIGLLGSITNLIETKKQSTTTVVTSDWQSFNEKKVNDKLQLTIYRIVQEHFNNIIKYAHAKNAFIFIYQKENLLELIIKDDGIGFDSSAPRKGVGLQNIKTRSEIHNGKMVLETFPGQGCVLKVEFPL